jgi:hypothetical protein
LPGCLVGTGCGGSAGRKGGCNHQGFWEDANCVGMTVVRDKFNELCCVSCHSAIGVGMFLWDDVTATQNPMGKLVGDSRFVAVVGEDAC